MARFSPSKRRSSGDGKSSCKPGSVGSGARGGGTARRASSGGRRSRRLLSPPLADVASSAGMTTNKRAAGLGNLSPVRVKRERVDSDRTIDKDGPTAWPESDAAVKTEGMKVSCKVEHTEAAGAFKALLRYHVFAAESLLAEVVP